MRHDLGTRRRERCVRLDVGPRGAVLQASLNDLERQLADALRATFEARQAAYDEEVPTSFLAGSHTYRVALLPKEVCGEGSAFRGMSELGSGWPWLLSRQECLRPAWSTGVLAVTWAGAMQLSTKVVSTVQVRKLTAGRQEPGWSFSTLFLVKDSLAIMLESASLLDDALREYAELEALFLETLPQPAAASATPFGTPQPQSARH